METGKIVLTCGHEDLRRPTGWELHIRELSWTPTGYEYAIGSVSYCTQCFCVCVLRNTEDVWTNYEEAKAAVYGQT